MHINVTCINLILCGVDRLPLEIRSSATDLQCNQVVLPAWLCQKTQSFFHFLWVFLHLATDTWRWADSRPARVRLWPSLSVSLQMTTSCCSARPCSGRCLRRRTERLCDCWLEIMLRSAAVWIPVPSTSSSQSITFSTAGHKKQWLYFNILRILMSTPVLTFKTYSLEPPWTALDQDFPWDVC